MFCVCSPPLLLERRHLTTVTFEVVLNIFALHHPVVAYGLSHVEAVRKRNTQPHYQHSNQRRKNAYFLLALCTGG